MVRDRKWVFKSGVQFSGIKVVLKDEPYAFSAI